MVSFLIGIRQLKVIQVRSRRCSAHALRGVVAFAPNSVEQRKPTFLLTNTSSSSIRQTAKSWNHPAIHVSTLIISKWPRKSRQIFFLVISTGKNLFFRWSWSWKKNTQESQVTSSKYKKTARGTMTNLHFFSPPCAWSSST